jgi:hypothetical protein
LIDNNTNNDKLSINLRQFSLGKLKSSNLNDEEYEKIKREKLEKEFFSLIEELNQLKEEVFFLSIYENNFY